MRGGKSDSEVTLLPCTNSFIPPFLILPFLYITGQVPLGLQADTKELASRKGPISLGS